MATVRRLPNGRWQARYRDPTGAQRGKSFAKKADAQRYAAMVETDKHRGSWVDPRLAATRFGDWATAHMGGKDLRASTRARDESYLRNHVLPRFGQVPVGRITHLDVQQWVRDLSESGLAPATVRGCFRLVSGVLSAAVVARLIPETPCRGISLPRKIHKEQRFLTEDEVESLVAVTPDHYQCLVHAAAYLGCRWGELAGLQRSNVNILKKVISIRGTLEEVNGKTAYMPETKTTSSRRDISIPGFLVEKLAAQMADARSDFVFTNARGGVLRRSGFRQRVWLPAVQRAGLEPLRFHDLRHTCVAILIANDTEAYDITRQLGHASIDTTYNLYGHLLPRRRQELADRMDAAYREAVARRKDPIILEHRKDQGASE